MRFEEGFYRKTVGLTNPIFYVHKIGFRWVAEHKTGILFKKSLFKTWQLEKIDPNDYDSLEESDAKFIKSKLEQKAESKRRSAASLENSFIYLPPERAYHNLGLGGLF